ncbi:MAG: protein kinase family protein [Alphaproteobacteria bacterium]
MTYPIISDYKTAMRNAASRFTTLKPRPVVDRSGAPYFKAGNFAAVFKAEVDGEAVAIKCFIRDLPEIHRRHDAISQFMARSSANCFITLRYLPEELFVTSRVARSATYPVAVMPWIEARTLGETVAFLCAKENRKGMAALTRAFARMSLSLLSLGVAHGDLKHDNMLVCSDGVLRLIDYEAMYVPALKGLSSLLLGGVHYQHPARHGKHFDAAIDHFSMLLIAVSLRALTMQPELHARYCTGENLVLQRQDFVVPRQSELVGRFLESPDSLLRDWTETLVRAAAASGLAISSLGRILRQAEKVTAEPVESAVSGLRSLFSQLSR